MTNLEVTIPHSLPQEEAIRRIRNQFSETKKNHGNKIKNFKEEWKGSVGNFSFSFQGFDVSGVLTVDHSSVELDAKIPAAVSLFKEAIKKTIYDKALKVLS